MSELKLVEFENNFTDHAFSNEAKDKGAFNFDGADYLNINLISTDVSTYGIDTDTVEIISIKEDLTDGSVGRPPVWNPSTSVLKLYAPDSTTYTALIVAYRWRDLLGRLSNIGYVYVNRVTRATQWVAWYTSGYCLISSGGSRTGYYGYATLQERYSDNLNPVLPLSFKSNVNGYPDYIAPTLNASLCPVASTVTSYLGVKNNTTEPLLQLVITGVVLKKSGQPDIVHSMNLTNGQQQFVAIVSQLYDSVEITYTSNSLNAGYWVYILNLTGAPSSMGTFSSSPFVLLNNAIYPSYGASLIMRLQY